jgi:hypothetical protein
MREVAPALLILGFGVTTAAAISVSDLLLPPGASRLTILLFAAGAGAIITALFWMLALGVQRSPAWAAVWLIGIWIPYVNLVLGSLYARRYWNDGGRGPGLLGIAGMVAQALAAILMLFPEAPRV